MKMKSTSTMIPGAQKRLAAKTAPVKPTTAKDRQTERFIAQNKPIRRPR
jgi:hypothetical protein